MHVCLTLSPTILISDMVGQIKGYCAHEVNRQVGTRDRTRQWQNGCGVVSFGTRTHNSRDGALPTADQTRDARLRALRAVGPAFMPG
jgi:hypothetical protein